jgi:predicted transcriptional regulator YdeE
MFKRKLKSFEIPSMTIAGLELITDSIVMPNSNYDSTAIAGLWEEFWAVFPRLGIKVSGTTFGVSVAMDQTQYPGKIKYLAGVQFNRGVAPGLEFKSIVVPNGKYVKYTHRGNIDNLKESYLDAYTQWFPKANMEMRDAPHLEVYDERYIPTSKKCEMDILIPVK